MAEERAALAVRVYGALLRLLPPDVHRADAAEMRATFGAQWEDARRERRALRVGARAFGRLPGVVLVEWIEHGLARAGGRTIRRGGGSMDRVARAVRQGGRSLGRSPAFVWSVVLLLGLGVGGVTTIFTLVDHVIVRPLPYPSADRLVELTNGSHSGPTWRGLQDLRSVEAWGAVWTETSNLTGVGRPEQLRMAQVTEDLLPMFGARPARGRLIVAEDFRTLDAAVISEGLWQRAFGADPEAVGREIVLDGRPHVIVGVMDAGFRPPEALTGSTVDVWRPIDWNDQRFADMGFHVLSVVGRLADGASVDAAQVEVDALVERLAAIVPERWTRRDGTRRELPLVSLHDATVRSEVRQGLGLLLGAVTLLLLVACTNVAHLFMARGISRVREMAVRRALGARTRALAGQLLVESLMVGLAGAALGVALGHAGIAAFLAWSPEAVPRASAVKIDLRVLGFAVAVGAVTALVFGMLPALRLVRRDATHALHGRARGNSGTRRDQRVRDGLVVAEVALSLVLVVQAGALLRGFVRLNAEPDLPVPTVRTLSHWAGEATARARFEAALFSTFGAVALLLVAGGLYGTLLYAVGQRRRELGIRLALGDAPRRLERRVLAQGVATAGVGCTLGASGAWGLARVLESRVAGLEAGDPTLLAIAVALLVGVALSASWLPARHAARTDPMEALRAE